MAEGHAIHGLARRLGQLTGQVVASSTPDGRFAEAAAFDGLVCEAAEAFGKNLIVRFAGADALVHVHLGMAGRFSVRRHRRVLGPDDLPRTAPPFARVTRWRLLTSTMVADLSAPTTCALLTGEGCDGLRRKLGPDPLRADDDPYRGLDRIRRSRRTLASLITDQSVIAGIGNVYRSELLFRQRVDPFLLGNQLEEGTFWRVWWDAERLMTVGADAGWIITHPEQLEPATDLLERGERVPRWPKRYFVYGRTGQPCLICHTPIQSRMVGIQRVFWCPRCQPPQPVTFATGDRAGGEDADPP